MYINEILFELKDILGSIVAVLGLIGTIISILQGLKNKKKPIILISLFVFILGCGLIMTYASSLVEVPNLKEKTYTDAKNILINIGLDFNTLRDCEDGIVKRQSIEAESIVTKGTLIELLVEGYTGEETKYTKNEIIEKLKENQYRFIKTNIAIYERKMEVVDEHGKSIRWLGEEIDYEKVQSVVFKSQEYGIEFKDYTIIPQYSYLSNACVVMEEEFPVGNYSVEIKVDGYDTFTSETDYTAENMGTEKEKNMTVYLIPKLNTQEYTIRVNLVDENFEPIHYTCYQIKFEEEPHFSYQFQLENKDYFFIKCIMDTEFIVTLYDDMNHEYRGDVKVDRAFSEIYLVQKKDGTIYQGDYVDYLNAISR